MAEFWIGAPVRHKQGDTSFVNSSSVSARELAYDTGLSALAFHVSAVSPIPDILLRVGINSSGTTNQIPTYINAYNVGDSGVSATGGIITATSAFFTSGIKISENENILFGPDNQGVALRYDSTGAGTLYLSATDPNTDNPVGFESFLIHHGDPWDTSSVVANGLANDFILQNNNVGNAVGMTLLTTSGNPHYIVCGVEGDNWVADVTCDYSNDEFSLNTDWTGAHILFRTNSWDKAAKITSAGSLLLGGSFPDTSNYKLDVTGNAYISGSLLTNTISADTISATTYLNIPAGGGTVSAAGNGLLLSGGDTVVLSGTLDQNTTIDKNGFPLTFAGTGNLLVSGTIKSSNSISAGPGGFGTDGNITMNKAGAGINYISTTSNPVSGGNSILLSILAQWNGNDVSDIQLLTGPASDKSDSRMLFRTATGFSRENTLLLDENQHGTFYNNLNVSGNTYIGADLSGAGILVKPTYTTINGDFDAFGPDLYVAWESAAVSSGATTMDWFASVPGANTLQHQQNWGWFGNYIASMEVYAGSNTSPRRGGEFLFRTQTSAGSMTNALRMNENQHATFYDRVNISGDTYINGSISGAGIYYTPTYTTINGDFDAFGPDLYVAWESAAVSSGATTMDWFASNVGTNALLHQLNFGHNGQYVTSIEVYSGDIAGGSPKGGEFLFRTDTSAGSLADVLRMDESQHGTFYNDLNVSGNTNINGSVSASSYVNLPLSTAGNGLSISGTSIVIGGNIDTNTSIGLAANLILSGGTLGLGDMDYSELETGGTLMHLHSGSAGSVAANGGADNFIMESSGDFGMTFLMPNSGSSVYGNIYWSYDFNDTPANIEYAHFADDTQKQMAIQTDWQLLLQAGQGGNTTYQYISSAGITMDTPALNVSGDTYTDGNLSALGNISATALNTGDVDFTYDEGDITLSAVGFSTPSSTTAHYSRIGNKVTLVIEGLVGASNSTSFAISGLPASIDTTLNQRFTVNYGISDNGTSLEHGSCQVGVTTGTIDFYTWASFFWDINGFTTSGSKGLSNPGISISYYIE